MIEIERIRHAAGFERVREAYESAWSADPHATLFSSWPWLAAYFAAIRARWTLLCARDGSSYAGFCLVLENGVRLGPLSLYRELALGAYPTADYTSLVIASDEQWVLAAFAGAIREMSPSTVRATSVRDPRVAKLMELLRPGHELMVQAGTPCRYVELPASWDAYTNNAEARYVLRRHRAWRNAGATFVESDDATIDRDIETLLRLQHVRWNSNLRKARATYGKLFREAYARGCCRVGVLYNALGEPLAAQAAFVDLERSTWSVYMLAYDCSASRHSPGIAMLAMGLEHAIAHGYGEYDFLRGDESYKERFGARLRVLDNYLVRRASPYTRALERLWLSLERSRPVVRRRILALVGR